MDGQPLGSNFTYEYIKTTFYISFYQRQLAREAGVFFNNDPRGQLGPNWMGRYKFYEENNINHSQKLQCCNKQAT